MKIKRKIKYMLLLSASMYAVICVHAIVTLVCKDDFCFASTASALLCTGIMFLITVLFFRVIRHSDKLVSMAEHDSLTGFYNKTTSEFLISNFIKNEGRDETHLFIILDIDNFKYINDNFGHLFGDKILSYVTRTIGGCFENSCIAGRIGGDEFVVFIKNGDLDFGKIHLDKLFKIFASHDVCCGIKYTVSVSAGISSYPDDGSDFKELYEKADAALYEAKNTGKNKYISYSAMPHEIYFKQ